MTNFPLRTDIPALDQVEVEYGKTNAHSVTIVSTNRSQTVLLIEPPTIGCEKCKYKNRSDDIKLKVKSLADKKIKAEADFILWAVPQIDEALFDKTGTAIEVEFDSETNGESITSGDCADILDDISVLGDEPCCVFKTPSFPQVYLGQHATVLPDSILGVKELTIYSKSVISRALAWTTVVKKAIKPVFSISAPSSIDLCASLHVDAVAISTRPMTWEWKCKSDKDFDEYLETAGFDNLLVLDARTPQMSKTDFTYKIEVHATNFLGTKSEQTVVQITKKRTPAPQIFFSPPAIMSVSTRTSSSYTWHPDPSPNTNKVTELAGAVVGLNLKEKESALVETRAICQSNPLTKASNVITVTIETIDDLVGGDAVTISGLSGAVVSGSRCTLGSVMVTLFENNTFTSSIGSTTVPDLCSKRVHALRHACFASTSPKMQLAVGYLLGTFAVCLVGVISWSFISRGKEAWRGCCCTRKTLPKRPRYSSLLPLVTALVLCATAGAVTRTELLGLISSCSDGSSAACAAVEEADTSTIRDMSSMFRGASFTGDLSQWDVSSVTRMSDMFFSSTFNGDISGWNTGAVYTMEAMFARSAFNTDISKWDVSAVNNMETMFDKSSFNRDISAWDTSSVTTMENMFRDSAFNSDISGWNTGAVGTMEAMFARSAFTGNIGQWDVSSVTHMRDMFLQSGFNGDLSKWDVSSVITMDTMFLYASTFTGNIGQWDVSSVRYMNAMFRLSAFNGDLSQWDVSKVEAMSAMFRSSSFNGNISAWD
eukprot:637410-Rhodomonas_salina.1